MGNKTRTAQQAHRIRGVGLPNGKAAYAFRIARFGDVLKGIVARVDGQRVANVPELTLVAAADWLKQASRAPTSRKPLCLTCEATFGGVSISTTTPPAFLAFVEAGNAIVVSFVCAACGAGKTLEEASAFAVGVYQRNLFKGDLDIGPIVSGTRT